MSNFSDYAVVYDISENRERFRVAKVLKGYGFRIQKSVFEVRLTKSGKERLIQNLEKLEIKTGFIKIYRLEYSYKSPIIGVKEGEDIDGGNAFVF